MTQEEKQLLIKDLCARIPNHVKVELHGEICTCLGYFDDFVMLTSNTPLGQQTNVANVKPYLRPMSSMTEEEINYLERLLDYKVPEDIKIEGFYTFVVVGKFIDSKLKYLINFLNERHFDYRGLIEKGLALEAPEEIYKN